MRLERMGDGKYPILRSYARKEDAALGLHHVARLIRTIYLIFCSMNKTCLLTITLGGMKARVVLDEKKGKGWREER